MSISAKIDALTAARNSLRTKMVAAGQAVGTEKLATLVANLEIGGDMGTKVTGTVSGNTLAFTDSSIGNSSAIDGPYIADVLVGVTNVVQSGTTVTFTLSDTTANGKSAYIWVRSV